MRIVLQSLLNAAKGTALNGTFDNDKLNFGIRYLEQHGVVRMLSEPTLVTLSGQPASFIAGGEFAVPTVVGVQGVSAMTTDFRAFGAIITFLPVILDKDHIRLQVSPEFSKVDQSLAVNGTPGLDTRSVTTTVEMRAGQTLAIAGLLDDAMNNTSKGDLPFVAQIFGSRDSSRQETELLILGYAGTGPSDGPQEVPPLPGFDVTEPNNTQFFLKGQLEGRPTENYRSTIWPMLRNRYNAGGSAMISGPYGHGRLTFLDPMFLAAGRPVAKAVAPSRIPNHEIQNLSFVIPCLWALAACCSWAASPARRDAQRDGARLRSALSPGPSDRRSLGDPADERRGVRLHPV